MHVVHSRHRVIHPAGDEVPGEGMGARGHEVETSAAGPVTPAGVAARARERNWLVTGLH